MCRRPLDGLEGGLGPGCCPLLKEDLGNLVREEQHRRYRLEAARAPRRMYQVPHEEKLTLEQVMCSRV